ncbi:helix-turn-helix domain-containing protein [Streptomyces candidus]|uniref:Transcriptional regulator with XRE-family HTH domain n=1 Tax=Streptomyces candidus TaxID=67283 RepID=A0A7X0HJA3_9ACTN|nr:helix-turn-helix transcriptional regulator [Streptomyces candidus]MBB6437198.1 transcriptional regulator with XRE-family HTH domain [Streptomyces candidus]GHH38179.1 transcriptional regulator [Streptomyces candidus]
MSTDFQQARNALGVRLRELRTEGGLTVRGLAAECGWAPSKVSKLENGKQTAKPVDLDAWARGVGRPELAVELKGRLAGLESTYRSWRRQLAGGHRAVQDALGAQHERTRVFRGFSASVIPGVFQTSEYARSVLGRYAQLHGAVRDIEAGVSSRVRRQEGLYAQDKRYHVLIGEAALHARVCSPGILADQLDRLMSVNGLSTVRLGIIPLTADVRVASGDDFWIHDDRLVIAESWHAEMWLDSAEDIALYRKVWDALAAAAVDGRAAHHIIARTGAGLESA